MRRFRLFFLVGLSCLAAAVLSFVLPRYTDVHGWLTRGWYWQIWIQITLTLYLVWETEGGHFWPSVAGVEGETKGRTRHLVSLVGVGLVFVGGIASAVAAEWRVLSDQTNLVGSSLSLYLERSYQNITEGYFYYDSLHPTASGLDNRPPLYPFVISIFHDLFGYSPDHGFDVNMLVGCGLGMVFYHVASTTLGKTRYGWLAIVMLMSWPILSQAIRSSGFEAINLLFLSLFYWQTYVFSKKPSLERLELILYIALAAAMCRYESIVLVLPTVILGVTRWQHLDWTGYSPRLLLLPLAFVPLNWQRYLTTSINPGDSPEGGPFGMRYLVPNVQHLGEFLFDPYRQGFPSSPFMASVAFMGLCVFGWRGIKKNLTRPELTMAMVLGLSVAGIVVVQCSFYMGDVRQVFQQRFVVSYLPALTVLGIYGFLWIEEEIKDRVSMAWMHWLLWSGALALGLNGLRQADIAYQGRWLTLYREYKASLAYLKTYPQQNTLFISDRPGMYVVHQYGAISFDTANRKLNDLKNDLERKLYQSILVEQRISYDPKKEPEPKLKLEKGLKLDPVFELQNDAEYYMRISKIILVPEDKTVSQPVIPPEKDGKKTKAPKGKGSARPKTESPKKEAQ